MFWILLALFIALVAWAALRQRRYGGSAAYDRDSFMSERWHHSEHNPWGNGPRAGGEEPPS
jgi:hypothetical protein